MTFHQYAAREGETIVVPLTTRTVTWDGKFGSVSVKIAKGRPTILPSHAVARLLEEGAVVVAGVEEGERPAQSLVRRHARGIA